MATISERQSLNIKEQENDMGKGSAKIQVVWGILLVLAGIGVFYRIPQVMPRIEKIEQFSSAIFFIRFCFYFLGVLLIGGGVKKVYDYYGKLEGGSRDI